MTGLLFLAAAAGAADFLGALLALAPLQFSGHALLYMLGMSAGYLLTWSISNLIPLLVQHDPHLVSWSLAGYFGLYILENLFASHAHPSEEGNIHSHALVDSWGNHTAVISRTACWVAVAGLLIHAFFDGAGIVSSFLIHPNIGALVFIAVLIHKIPEGSSLTSILAAAKKSASIIIATAAATMLVTILGGIAAFWIGAANPTWSYPLLALSAGTFFFIGASNLIPATQKGESKGTVLAVLAGVFASYGVQWLLQSAGID